MIGKTCSTRYKRQEETKDLLEYVHGGSDGSIFGAWDYIRRYATEEQLESFVVSFKKGKFVERIHGSFQILLEKVMQPSIKLLPPNINCICRGENIHSYVAFKIKHLILKVAYGILI